METHTAPRIVTAERLSGGVVIQVEDGRCALYSSTLLYATLPQAEELIEEAEEDL
jgi:hypothetical protein